MRRIILLISVFFFSLPLSAQTSELKWTLSAQAYTFKKFSFEETLEKLKTLNIHSVEAFPNQTVYTGEAATMSYEMSSEKRGLLKKLLEKYDVKLLAYGVVSGNNEEDWKKIFKFAKDMGIVFLTSEPEWHHLDMVNQLAGEYKIKVALHNHPVYSKNNIYWNPDIVLEALKGRENLGVCADVGHWVRSGIDPVESLKKLEGKILNIHFKDLNEIGRKAHDVPWGTGVSDVDGMLKELKRQNYTGNFSIEYEYNWENSMPEVLRSVDYFRTKVQELENNK